MSGRRQIGARSWQSCCRAPLAMTRRGAERSSRSSASNPRTSLPRSARNDARRPRTSVIKPANCRAMKLTVIASEAKQSISGITRALQHRGREQSQCWQSAEHDRMRRAKRSNQGFRESCRSRRARAEASISRLPKTRAIQLRTAIQARNTPIGSTGLGGRPSQLSKVRMTPIIKNNSNIAPNILANTTITMPTKRFFSAMPRKRSARPKPIAPMNVIPPI